MKLRCACGEVVDVAEDTVRVTCSRCVARMMNPKSSRQGKPAKPPAGLHTFIARTCCNFISGKHQGERPCDVLAGFRCLWLEKAALPTAPADLIAAYKKRYLEAREKDVEIGGRRCKCGAVVGKFQQLCGRCKRIRRRASYRVANSKRDGAGSTTKDGISP